MAANSKSSDPDDKFLAATMEAAAWARSNTQKLVVGVLAVVVVVLALVYYVNQRSTYQVEAVNELVEIQSTLALGDPEAGKGRLREFIDQYGGTPVAGEARMTLAQLYLETSEPGSAIDVLQPMARDLAQPLNLQAAVLLAAAYEDNGDFAEAEELYVRVANRSDLEFQVRDALTSAARIRVQTGDLQGARTLYQEILDGMESSDPMRPEIEMRLAEVNALLEVTG